MLQAHVESNIKSSETMKINQIIFHFVCNISPQKEPQGPILQFMPQRRYKNDKCLSINRYGEGPFCKFKIHRDYNKSGVYAIVADGAVKYIGECINLSSRYNVGYGNISPRNCFIGGQETNCRINNLIYLSTEQGKNLSLWFFATNDYKSIEEKLRTSQKLEWNRI